MAGACLGMAWQRPVPLLKLNGFLGLFGWQWMFIAEALPALLLGLVVLRTLKDRPHQVGWLKADEREWLEHHW